MIKQNIRKKILAFLIAFIFIGAQIAAPGFVPANAEEGISLQDNLTIEPVLEEPVSGETVSEEPVLEEPVSGETVSKEPISDETVSKEPVVAEPEPETAELDGNWDVVPYALPDAQDITVTNKYYFKAAAGTSPTVEFTAAGADYWESDNSSVASVDQNGVVTAVAPGTAKITARSGGAEGSVVATADVYVPVISEDFEGMTAANPPTAGWGIAADGTGNGTPTANPYVNQSGNNGTYFGVVSMTDAPAGTTNAFEFATAGSQGSRGRGLQKNFTKVKEDKVELDFDWNIGNVDANLTWLSIKDSEFAGGTSNNKGFRYLSLAAEYAAPGIVKVSYSVNGGRDANVNVTTGNDFLAPTNRQTLFTNVPAYTWYNVHVTLDFTEEKIEFILTEKGNTSNTSGLITKPFPTDLVTADNLDFGSISLLARGANSVQNTAYADATVKMYVDNFNVYGCQEGSSAIPSYPVTVNNGTGSGNYKAGDTVTVKANDNGDDTGVTGWTTVPADLSMTRDASDPFKYTFIMPETNVTLTPVYGLMPHDISSMGRYYFKSDYYSESGGSLPLPQVRFSATGAVAWESDNTNVSVIADADPTTAVVTAGSVPGETAVITARDSGGGVIGTVTVYMPIISESFENVTPITPPSHSGWDIPLDGNGSPGENIGYHTTAGTSFGVVSMTDAPSGTTNAFEFAADRGDGLLRGVQKRFSPVKQDMVELNFDWNSGNLNARSMWVSIKDSTFAAANSTDKGYRYLVLRSEYVSAGKSRLSYGTGGRDDNGGGSGTAPNVPADIKPLFGGVTVDQHTWYNVNVTLNFKRKTTTLTVTNKTTGETTGEIEVPFPSDLIAANKLDLGAISIISQGAGNNAVSTDYANFAKMQVDNFSLYGYAYTGAPINTVSVANGIGSGTYDIGSKVTVRADKGMVDKAVTGWEKTPSDLVMTQSEADPYVWSFTMPDSVVTLEPLYEPYNIAADTGNKYYFMSDYYSTYVKSAQAPQVQFGTAGAVVWESSDPAVAAVAADTNPSTAIVTAGNPGMATIKAKASNGGVVAAVDVYVPTISEDFENPPVPQTSFDKWSITDGGNSGSPSLNITLPTGYSQFGVVASPDADGFAANRAFEFASGRGDTTFRGVQKRFSPVKKNVAELNFDWNIGNMARTSTWLSIKDSEFGGDTTSNKGFRYLALKVDFISASSRRLFYDSGKRDATNTAGGNEFLTPISTNPLFGGASQSPNTWYNVHVALDYVARTTTFSLTNKATGETTGEITIPFPDDLIGAGNLDFGAISLISAGAGNNSTNYADYPVRMYVDNFNVYGYDYAPRNVTVTGALLEDGTGSGSYKPGDEVTVTVEGPKDGQAFRRWETNPEGIVMTKDAEDPLKWTFTMPVSDVELTAIYGAEYEILIGGQTDGGAGRKRELTVIGDLTDKNILVRLTEADGSKMKTIQAVIKATENAVISYQRDRTKVEVFLTDLSGNVIYASALVDPTNQ